MYILGIHNASDAGVCLIKNNKILYAINEERLNRKKMFSGFPHKSLEMILLKFDLKISDIDYFVYGWCGKKNDIYDYNIKFTKRMLEECRRDNKNYKLINERVLAENIRDNFRRISFDKECKKLKINTNKIIYIDHHQSHAWSAFSGSPFKKSLVFTLDGRGDLRSGLVAFADEKNGLQEKDYLISTFDGLGFLYGQITHYLGFTPHKHEGKVTGLAAFGNYKKTIKIFRKIVNFEKGTIKCKLGYYRPFYTNLSKNLIKDLKKHKKEDIAAGLQIHCESVISKWVNFWVKQYKGKQNVCLAGGVFGNVKINQIVSEIKNVKNVYVFPHMADGGIPFGSAALASFNLVKKKKIKFENMYSGTSFNDSEILKALKKQKKIKFKRIKNKSFFIAKKIFEKKIIGVFNGKMEYGPRALGNRSILANPKDSKINDTLNKRLNRTEFMPFAPVTPIEFANKCYVGWKKSHTASKFMTRTYKCTKSFIKRHPAVVHIDETARPQIISKNDNSSYYDIVKTFCDVYGYKSIINTSFNLHEEPIVCNPDDAILSLKRKGIDILVIGNFIVELK